MGVFGDVACITVAPIALQMARRAGYHKMGVLMAQLGAVRAGNVMSPNPNAIAAAEAFNLPLTSIIAVGVIPAVTALIVTSLLAKRLSMRGTEITEADIGGEAAHYLDDDDVTTLKRLVEERSAFHTDHFTLRKSLCLDNQNEIGAALRFVKTFIDEICGHAA